MAKVYISLTADTAELLDFFAEAFKGHSLKINARTRTTPLDGGKSKMQEANEWGADLYIAVRQGGTGLSVKAAGQNGSKSWELCENVHEELVTMLPDGYEDKGVSNGDAIAEIAQTNMTSVYVIWYEPNDTTIVEPIAEPCLEWLKTVQSIDPPVQAPDEGDKPETPDIPYIPSDISDAELGAAFRIVCKAFWEAQNV